MSMDKFDMPEEVRQMLEKGISQAREGFEKAMGAATEAMGTLEAKAGAAQDEALELRKKSLTLAETTINAAFDHARSLIGAKSVEDAIRLQTGYLSQQMSSLSGHMSEAGAEIQKKAQSMQQELSEEASKMQAKAREAMEQGMAALKDVNPFKPQG